MEDIKEELPKPILIKDLGMMFHTESSKTKVRFGLYKCGFCGTDFKANTYSVVQGKIKSCGCYQKQRVKESKTTHTLTNSRIYNTWAKLKDRVLNPKNTHYQYYGGRGIIICDDWKNDFISFYDWAMSNGYSDELSIDRIDNDGNYCPENCRWTTRTIQARNQRIQKNNTSGYRGVYYRKDKAKYQSCIVIGKNRIYLGYFLTAEDGAIAYNNYIIANDLEGFPLNKLPDSHIHLQLPTKPHHQTLE